MVIVDSPRVAQKYLRRVSKDFSTVRRFSSARLPHASTQLSPDPQPVSAAQTVDGIDNVNDVPIGKSESFRGIRQRQYARKRSSVSSTLTRVLILNVRDLLRVTDMREQESEHTPRSWIETNFQKRECIKFIPSKDET
ncbi:PREDICTED: transient receptor potential cation channel trpm-like, partial [Rhagoletis zephyria]|uniref:transient receptor potential cation channel trpm-like n=1 Tax=Rhagoletis zephyria TaxID=28612 RepID=UPI0008112392